jgi:hypothetical protein
MNNSITYYKNPQPLFIHYAPSWNWTTTPLIIVNPLVAGSLTVYGDEFRAIVEKTLPRAGWDETPHGAVLRLKWPRPGKYRTLTAYSPYGNEIGRLAPEGTGGENVTVVDPDDHRWDNPYQLREAEYDALRKIFARYTQARAAARRVRLPCEDRPIAFIVCYRIHLAGLIAEIIGLDRRNIKMPPDGTPLIQALELPRQNIFPPLWHYGRWRISAPSAATLIGSVAAAQTYLDVGRIRQFKGIPQFDIAAEAERAIPITKQQAYKLYEVWDRSVERVAARGF